MPVVVVGVVSVVNSSEKSSEVVVRVVEVTVVDSVVSGSRTSVVVGSMVVVRSGKMRVVVSNSSDWSAVGGVGAAAIGISSVTISSGVVIELSVSDNSPDLASS